MSYRLDAEMIEVASFTAELIEQKFADIGALTTDYNKLSILGNRAMREAATDVYNEQLRQLCAELGELALSLPIEQIDTEHGELEAVAKAPIIKAETTAKSVASYVEALRVLMPFAKNQLEEDAKQVTNSLSSVGTQVLDNESQEKLDRLSAIEAALATPITSSQVANELFNYFDSDSIETDKLLDGHKAVITLVELNRQLTETEPRLRLLEFCMYFPEYPVEINVLADAVYRYDVREQKKKYHIMAVNLNPRQRGGSITYRDLAEGGFILQHGWITYKQTDHDKVEKRRKVVRSVKVRDYSSETHVGRAFDDNAVYEWEAIDANILSGEIG
jgi:hypothetical protein